MASQSELRQRARSPVEAPSNTAGIAAARGAAALGGQRYGDSRGSLLGAVGTAQQAAMGQGPSQARAMIGQAAQQGVVNQLGMAAQARGPTLAAQQRQAAGIGAAAQMGQQQQLANLAAQEQIAARGQYLQGAQGLAGMDLQSMLAANQLQQGALSQEQQLQLQAMLASRGMDIQQLQQGRQFGMGLAGMIGNTAAQIGAGGAIPGGVLG